MVMFVNSIKTSIGNVYFKYKYYTIAVPYDMLTIATTNIFSWVAQSGFVNEHNFIFCFLFRLLSIVTSLYVDLQNAFALSITMASNC